MIDFGPVLKMAWALKNSGVGASNYSGAGKRPLQSIMALTNAHSRIFSSAHARNSKCQQVYVSTTYGNDVTGPSRAREREPPELAGNW
jgi:hypothetical protein